MLVEVEVLIYNDDLEMWEAVTTYINPAFVEGIDKDPDFGECTLVSMCSGREHVVTKTLSQFITFMQALEVKFFN